MKSRIESVMTYNHKLVKSDMKFRSRLWRSQTHWCLETEYHRHSRALPFLRNETEIHLKHHTLRIKENACLFVFSQKGKYLELQQPSSSPSAG